MTIRGPYKHFGESEMGCYGTGYTLHFT